METSPPRQAAHRYERKFSVPAGAEEAALLAIKTHPALFREKYPPRSVNNLYLDTWDLPSYRDNLAGVRDRRKVRIRWYGDLFGHILRPTLEIKIKRGLVGEKTAYPLGPFRLDREFGRRTLRRVILEAGLPEPIRADLAGRDAVLLNRYRRRYFESFDRSFRLTVDERMEYYRVDRCENHFLCRAEDRSGLIVELKYPPECDRSAARISEWLSARLTRNSKFVCGIEQVYGRAGS